MNTSIQNYYKQHSSKLHKLFSDNESLISGRICHPSIILIHILLQLDTSIKNYMEIGVHNGGSLSMVISTNRTFNIYGIDLFEYMYDSQHHPDKKVFEFYQYFKRDNLSIQKTISNIELLKKNYNNNSTYQLIQGNTYHDTTEQLTKQKLQDTLIDLLFIDGDHTPKGVQNDLERYSKFVKKNGYIIFDDYHHPAIKIYVDNLLLNNKHLYTPITIF